MPVLLKNDTLMIQFNNINEKIEKLKEWKLLSRKTNELKDIYYKKDSSIFICEVIGYFKKKTNQICMENFYETVVIKVNDNIIKICPAYLLEMQKKDFSSFSISNEENNE